MALSGASFLTRFYKIIKQNGGFVMKRQWKVMMLAVLTLLVILFTAGCGKGARILTDVTLEDDFSGARVMEVSIDKSVFDDYFSGTFDDIKDLLEKECPSQLSWTIEEADSSYTCTFTLEFDSIETYKDKVTSLIGEDFDIHVVKADTVFANGISYNENFRSSDLLEWFSDALVDREYVSSDNKNEIFQSDTTTFEFDSKEYETSNRIDVSDMSYLDNGIIDILTKPYYDETYDRTIIFHIPEETMEKKSEEIKSFLESGVPSNANISWEEDLDYRESIFKIEIERATVDQLDSSMKSIFHTEDASVSLGSYSGDLAMLEFGNCLLETIDVSQFVSNTQATATIGYYYESSSDIKANQIEDEYEDEIYIYEGEDYSDYNTIYRGDVSKVTYQVESKTSYIPDLIKVFTEIKGSDQIHREIDFVYKEGLEEGEASKLEGKINSAVGEHAELTFDRIDNEYIVKFTQTGSKEEVSSGFEEIFKGGSSSIHYGKEKSKFKTKVTSAFEENFSFEEIFGYEKPVPIDYTLKLKSGEKINSDSISFYDTEASLDIKKNSLTISTDNPHISIILTASSFNSFALFWWLLIVLLVVGILVAGYMGYLKIKEMSLEKTKQGQPSFLEDGKTKLAGLFKGKETKEGKEVKEEKTCPSCGVINSGAIKFCTKCGTNLDKDPVNK